jgi:hypothetical protein
MFSGKNGMRGARPWDLITPAVGRVSEAVRNERYSICESCPLLHPIMKTCSACGCFMAQKTKLPNASCPKGKWGEHEKE